MVYGLRRTAMAAGRWRWKVPEDMFPSKCLSNPLR